MAVGLNVGALATGCAEVFLSFTGGGSSQQESVGTGRSLNDEFIDGLALATSLGDAGTSSLGEAESSNVELRAVQKTFIISDSANNNNGSVSFGTKVLNNFGDGDRGSVGTGGNESAQDGLCEGGASSAGEESEQLDQQLVVQVLGLGVALVLFLEAASVS